MIWSRKNIEQSNGGYKKDREREKIDEIFQLENVSVLCIHPVTREIERGREKKCFSKQLKTRQMSND